jgi:hypothetical protein
MKAKTMKTNYLNQMCKAAQRHSRQAPDRIVSVYQTRQIGSGRYLWAGIRLDETRTKIEYREDGLVAALYKTFLGGEEVAC